jgi:hypothetical protein
MHLQPADDGRASRDARRTFPFQPVGSLPRSERVREIRQRVADDAYRSLDVVDEIARRILCSGDL